MDAPLVNEYKKGFIIKRVLTTFFGGLKIYFTSPVPVYCYVIQILLFAFIPCLCGISLHLLDRKLFPLLYVAIANGCITLLYALFIQLFALCLQRQKPEKDDLQVDSFGDEEIFIFDSVFGPKTWLCLFPPKDYILSIFGSSVVAGVVSSLTVYYLHLEPKEELFWNEGLRWGFLILGVITYSVGIWPLIVGSPPEPAIFGQLPYDLQDYSRATHMLTCFFIHGIASLHPGDLWLLYADCFGHTLFAFSSMLWLIGALPPLDAYFLWGVERGLVLFLGGTPTSSNKKLILHFLFGLLTLLLLASLPNFIAFCVVAASAGFLLSLDWGYLLCSLRRKHTVQNVTTPDKCKPFFLKRFLKQEVMFYSLILCGVCGLSVLVHLPEMDWYKMQFDSEMLIKNNSSVVSDYIPPIFQTISSDALWGCLLLLSSVMKIIHNIQKPFIFVWFRNPFYQKLHNYRSKLFLALMQIIRYGGPFISLIFIHVLVGRNDPSIPFGRSFRDSFFVAISFLFIFRQIWQSSEYTMLVLSLYLAVEKMGGEALQNTVWGDVIVSVKIHLISVVITWIKGAWRRFETIFMFSATSVLETKQRKLINYFLVGMNLGLLPLLVILSLFCAVLSIPLLPLFTLPLFLIGFPRSLRFWWYPVGYSANHCADTIYYQQLVPYVSRGLHQCFLCGSLGNVSPGDFFLLRWEDRLIWIQVLEIGFGYQYYSFKGLELQETSCHTTEASRVDSIFSRAFDQSSGSEFFNPLSFHCLSPLTTLTAVGYSDTRNVLTGVIDSPETLKMIREYFSKALLYFLLDHALAGDTDALLITTRPPSAASRPGSTEAKTLKAFSSLPKAERVGNSRVSIRTTNDESPSLSQSGRGSRMAWVSATKLALQGANGSTLPEDATSERENNVVVVRPASWDSKDDPLETNRNPASDTKEDYFLSYISNADGNNKGKEKPRPIPTSKAKSYVKELDSPSDVKLLSSDLRGVSSSSESETESTKEFFTKSIPQRPQQRHRESDSFRLSDNPTLIKDLRRTFAKSPKTALKASHVVSLAPPKTWLSNLPYDEETLEDWQESFPLMWFKFLLKRFGMLKVDRSKSSQTKPPQTVHVERFLERLLADELLEDYYRMLLAICSMIILGSDISFPTTNQVLKIFSGKLPHSKGKDWVQTHRDLLEILLKSYRIAVKLSLDHTLVCPINNSWKDLESALEEYSSDWFVGPDKAVEGTGSPVKTELSWNKAVKEEVPCLFALGYCDVKGVYTSHLLTLGEAEINLGRLDGETVRSIWANLTGELLYLTNDDDERYSIQAHPVLLRNLTIQAADPPLGYPIYSSSPVSMGPS